MRYGGESMWKLLGGIFLFMLIFAMVELFIKIGGIFAIIGIIIIISTFLAIILRPK